MLLFILVNGINLEEAKRLNDLYDDLAEYEYKNLIFCSFYTIT